ncbi:uncharacterized protein F4812DRAFT_466033 [Daldinia caldariorum]|uniref:uncharacterized protein n=1 Tax=Daldinia caldariorum TaxID=326644 RepID=UPI002007C6DD|nr:uncharacterized protein F4812DRAFT_466033 [Daldinia caldariorum]KAI1466240.1 hypothetical protein F4812DRAFT_466033 [Daldinia caldariorum]
MVTPACYPPSDVGRRYSRACPPYPSAYSDRRYHSSQDVRSTAMTDREIDSESSQPRKRIAVACGRCRKRKIRCSGDPGNGQPCSNCKNAGHEPCLFLRVSSTETQLRNDGNEFGYNIEVARTYSNQTRVAVSQLSAVPQYSGEDVIASYRQGHQYTSYGGKYPYSTVPGWTSTYSDEGVEYNGLNYPYQIISQEPAHIVQGYGRYGSGKPVYVDPESSQYSFGSLAHRPVTSSESPTGFSLSGMAASLPNASDRIVPSDRLLPQVNRTLTSSSSYRPDGITSYAGSKTSPGSSMSEVSYSNLNSTSFEPPYSTGTPNPLPSQRSGSHSDATTYEPNTAPTTDALYTSGADQSLRPTEDSNSSFSYIYSDKLESSRRNSQSSCGASGGSVLPNGHIYVPDSHHTHAGSSQAYVSPQDSAVDGATTSSSRGGSGNGPSHMHMDGHRRSAGNLRGG